MGGASPVLFTTAPLLCDSAFLDASENEVVLASRHRRTYNHLERQIGLLKSELERSKELCRQLDETRENQHEMFMAYMAHVGSKYPGEKVASREFMRDWRSEHTSVMGGFNGYRFAYAEEAPGGAASAIGGSSFGYDFAEEACDKGALERAAGRKRGAESGGPSVAVDSDVPSKRAEAGP